MYAYLVSYAFIHVDTRIPCCRRRSCRRRPPPLLLLPLLNYLNTPPAVQVFLRTRASAVDVAPRGTRRAANAQPIETGDQLLASTLPPQFHSHRCR